MFDIKFISRRFGGPLSWVSGMWEPVDWTPFDMAPVDAYPDAGNAGRFRLELRRHLQHGKPLAVTEFGCCGYAGAADRGGLGWAILDTSAEPPVLDATTSATSTSRSPICES